MRQRRERGGAPGVASRAILPLGVLLAATLLSGMRPARAQILESVLPPAVPGLDTSPGVTVLGRVHAGYEDIPLQLGGVLIQPSITENTGYESNVLASNTARGSPFVSTDPELVASETWSSGASIVADFNLSNVQFFSMPDESYTNDTIALGGVLPAGEQTISLGYAHLDINVLPTEINFVGITEPLLVHLDQLSSDDRVSLGRVTLDPNVTLVQEDFSDTIEDGTYQPMSYLDRFTVAGGVNAYYELAPQRNVVVSLRTEDQTFGKTDPYGAKFDNQGGTALVGYRDNTGGVFNWYALIGYQTQVFAADYPTQSEPVGEGAVIWQPTGLDTVTAAVKREIEDAVQANQIGYTYLRADLRLDHELERNILLKFDLGYEDASREDTQGNYVAFDTGATWLLNHHLRLVADVLYQHYTSNVDIHYDNVTTTFGVRFGL